LILQFAVLVWKKWNEQVRQVLAMLNPSNKQDLSK
jgi:hypothetical protein